jgi:hypothetical protein
MTSRKSPPILEPDVQIALYYKLKTIKELYFHEALAKAVRDLNISQVDQELSYLVSNESLQKLAAFSIRGEAIFPVPSILKANPYLLGYYRLLLGFSQKDFYKVEHFGAFKLMEDKGRITKNAEKNISDLCTSLIASAELFVNDIDVLSLPSLHELQLLTVGPQFRGGISNKLGQAATQKTFNLIKELIEEYVINSTLTYIEIRNDSGRIVMIEFASDPDIEIKEVLPSKKRSLVSVEIKGGRDISNIHNRIGEAEKSHLKAKARGYNEFITIVNVNIDYAALRRQSPTTSHFFNLDRLSEKTSDECNDFKELLSSLLSINI